MLVSRPLDTAWLAGPSSVPGGWGAWDVLLVPVLFVGVGAIWIAAWAALASAVPMEFVMVERPLSDFHQDEPGEEKGHAASPLG